MWSLKSVNFSLGIEEETKRKSKHKARCQHLVNTVEVKLSG